ncbi:MAG: energy transducer TonB [Prevotella sp.]|jgi:thiol-disulfide isomerase/thioredoxin|nr:energy transducer TonB [Prevotella sp.]MCI1282114.1 energy transducer TonB [Prevotella sp.]
MKKLLILAVLLLGSSITISAQDLDEKYGKDLLQPGTQAPDFLFIEGEKDSVTLKMFHESYLVLDFWASWCGDCRKVMPDMEALSKKYSDGSVNFVGISFDTDTTAWKHCITSTYKLMGYQVSEFKKWKETQISKDYHINWIPTMYLIDPQGKVDMATVDIHKLEKRLEELQSADSLVKYKVTMPQFPGGFSALMDYLRTNIKYPHFCEKRGLQARVAVSFVVDRDGSINDIKEYKYELKGPIPSSLPNMTKESFNEYLLLCHQQFTKAAMQVVRKMPKWSPGLKGGKPVRVKYRLPINFSLR